MSPTRPKESPLAPVQPLNQVIVNLNLSKETENAQSRIDAVGTSLKPKGSVGYREGSGALRCEACEHGEFAVGSVDGVCDLVAGPIRSSAVCDLFDPVESEEEEAAEDAMTSVPSRDQAMSED